MNRSMTRFLTLALIGVSLTACGGMENDVAEVKKADVTIATATHESFFAHGATQLEGSEQVMLKRFLAETPNISNAHVTLVGGNYPLAKEQLKAVTKLLKQSGVAREHIQWQRESGLIDTVKLQAETATLHTPEPCPDWSADSTSNHYNKDMSNFGCAYWTVFSKQVSDPRDLVRGRGEPAYDVNRNAVAFDRYRKMEPLGGSEQAEMLESQSESQ
jgi:pilus biogenesis lipoprotein CpaD